MAQVMELTINGNIFKFRAGFAFIREVEPMKKQKQNGVEQDVGLNYILGGLYDGDVDCLLTALDAMNKSETVRVTRQTLEQYIEDCEDIDKLFEEVMDFLSGANCTKKKAARFMEMVKDLEKKQKAENGTDSAPGERSTGNA